MKNIIGIGGLIASGKSEVAKILQELKGGNVISSALLLKKLFGPGQEGYRQIVNYFGDDFVKKNGELNMKKLEKFIKKYRDF